MIVDAIQWTGKNPRDVFNFLGGSPVDRMRAENESFRIDHSKVEGGLIIKTSEGEHIASINDWIIKGVKGEFYPCKPDAFEQTYRPASEPSNFKERLEIEKYELHCRMVKLQKFVETEPFMELDPRERSLLRGQLAAMQKYYGVLNERCYFHAVGKWSDEG